MSVGFRSLTSQNGFNEILLLLFSGETWSFVDQHFVEFASFNGSHILFSA
jgi:hypothetical protein